MNKVTSTVRILLVLNALVLLGAGAPALAQQVLAGDPIDPATGTPYSILPGRPLLYPGPDGRFGTADDVIEADIIGDIDVVLRTGGRFDGRAIPATAAGIAAAPRVVAGGLHGRTGSLVPFQLIVSDGSSSLGGKPLLSSELDLRRALIVAYADLDGDGFIGPTVDADPTNDQIQRQEALTFVGRAMAEFHGGVASGSIGVSLGAPASIGGLGIVVGAGAATGATPNLYADGPWIATSLPYMIPLDQARIVGGELTGPVDPVGLVDLELSPSALYLPPPTHPILGGIYAVPLDGSDASVDLLRSESAPAAGAGFGVPIDRATFVAGWGRIVRVVPDAEGARQLVQDAGTISVSADGSTAGVLLYPVDLLGNPTDPPSAGQIVTVEASGGPRIVSPDVDGDPFREVIEFRSPAAIALLVDGGGAPAGSTGSLTAAVDALPTGKVLVAIGQGGIAPTPSPRATARSATPTPKPAATPTRLSAPAQSAAVTLRHSKKAGRDEIRVRATFSTPVALDFPMQPMTVSVTGPGGPIYSRTFAPGTFKFGRFARRAVFREKTMSIAIQQSAQSPVHGSVSLFARALDLSGAPVDIAGVELAVTIGAAELRAPLACGVNLARTVTRCAP